MRPNGIYPLAALALAAAAPVHAAPSPVANSKKRNRDRSRYMPHQGPREIARRLRQAARKAGE